VSLAELEQLHLAVMGTGAGRSQVAASTKPREPVVSEAHRSLEAMLLLSAMANEDDQGRLIMHSWRGSDADELHRLVS
jgi:hypothetical protein